jgi:hypothetical protein
MRPSFLLFLLAVSELLLVAAPPQEPALYPIKRHLKTGFIDSEGKVVIEPQFDVSADFLRGEAFAEGLQPVAKDGKWGYIDRLGKVRIPFQFSQAEPFSEGLAAVRVESVRNGGRVAQYGYIDHTGVLKIPATFDYAQAFSEGVACVGRNYKWGYVDKSGAYLVDLRFDSMGEFSAFSEGLAGAYRKGAPDPQKSNPGGGNDGLWGYIDKTGGWMLPPRYKSISPFRDGLAAVAQEGETGMKFIDHSGQMVFGPFSLAWPFSEGLARVQPMSGGEAFINREGKVQFLLDGDFGTASSFSDAMAQVEKRTMTGGYRAVGYIDRTGKLAIPAVYDGGSAFRNGRAAVSLCGQTGYIGKSGEPVWGIQPRASSAPPEAAPSPSVITPLMMEKIMDHPDPLTLKVKAGSGACGALGKQIWSIEVTSTDRIFEGLAINLLEGGTFLNEERIDDFKGFQEQFQGRFKGQSQTSSLAPRAVDPQGYRKGYVSILGLGPGGSMTAASVFSPDQAYEVQVLLSLGGSARGVKDPFGFAGKIAMEVVSVLFGQR